MDNRIFKVEDMASMCYKEIRERIEGLTELNIIVMGKSGVGKGTLINSFFRDKPAETGIGRPVTRDIKEIRRTGYPLHIYDTPGLELGAEQQARVKNKIMDMIEDGIASNDINKAIHCIWYCINVAGNRFEEAELNWLRELTDAASKTHVPVIVVLTQGYPRTKAIDMKLMIEHENLNVASVVPVLAQDMNFDGEYTAKAYGLDTLISVMTSALPDELQNTLQNLQIADMDLKRRHARKIVAASVAVAFGEGFAPIPFSDAALLVPTQISMIAGITSAYGVDISTGSLVAIISSTLGGAGTTILGKALVSNIIKMIPGVGSVAGGLISGGIAASLTTAMGEAYIRVMDMVCREKVDLSFVSSDEGMETIKRIFEGELRNPANVSLSSIL